MLLHIANAAVIAAGSIPNPLDGIFPDFSIFGTEFNQLWQKLLAGIWGIVLIGSVIFFFINLGKMSAATASANPGDHQMAKKATITSAILIGVCAAAALIVGTILFIVSLG
jgi:predicted small integral membrane protein